MLVPLEKPSRNARFALSRKDETVNKVWQANALNDLTRKVERSIAETLTNIKKYKDNQLNAAKMLNNEANNPEYSSEERTSFKKKAQGHLDIADEAEALYKKIKTDIVESLSRQSKVLDNYIRFGVKFDMTNPAIERAEKALEELGFAKNAMNMRAVDAERAITEAGKKFPASKQKFAKKAAEYMRAVTTKKTVEISDLIKKAIIELDNLED